MAYELFLNLRLEQIPPDPNVLYDAGGTGGPDGRLLCNLLEYIFAHLRPGTFGTSNDCNTFYFDNKWDMDKFKLVRKCIK